MCCKVIKTELDNEFISERYITHIKDLIVELKRRFELMGSPRNRFNNPQCRFAHIYINVNCTERSSFRKKNDHWPRRVASRNENKEGK